MKLVLCALALVACACARTTTRVQNVSPQITSLSDKDALSKATTHPAFANAGRQAGVEIWRIENFEPVPVASKDYGKFYKGDSYIVLKTTSDKRSNLSWDIHYWIGSESSQDESGAAAILTVGLDNKFNGKAVQHRETLGYESAQFKGYFSPAISYLDGGHASGFNHVTTNAGAEKRMFQVKGKRNVRVRQVDPVISSMNKGDVFILDKGHDIFVYVGDKARNVEKLKAISFANQVRDQDHRGRGTVDIVDQYSSEVDVQKFFTALGSGSRQLVPDESAGGDDQQFEKNEEQIVSLSEVSESGGKVKVTALPKPIRQEQLKPQDVYILDTVSGSIYVWIGKQATDKEKTEGMAKAQQLLAAKKYPSWVSVVKIPQGTETAIFKQYFSSWRDVGMSHHRIVRSASDDGYSSSEETNTDDGNLNTEDATKVRSGQPWRDYMVNRVDGAPMLFKVSIDSANNVRFKSIPEFKQSALAPEEIYFLDAGSVIFVWIGDNSLEQQRKSAKTITDPYLFDNRRGDEVTLVVTKQGLEPEAFTKMFEKWDPDMWQKRQTQGSDSFENNEIDIDK